MEYKWKAFSVTSLGSLMAAVDSTVVLLALFPIAADLRTDFITVVWVVLAYLLVSTTFGITLGRLGDLFGRKQMYLAGFGIFTVGSLLCGLAPSGISLVGFRAIQGFGAALLMANSFAIISEAFPARERGRAFGGTAVVWGFGSILGIILGGVIIAFTTWRLIFLINLPIGLVGTLWGYWTLRSTAARPAGAGRPYFDLVGGLIFTAAITLLLVAVSWGLLYGWGQIATIGMLVGAGILFPAFARWETRYALDPVIHAEFFRNRAFTYGVATAFLQMLALFSVNFLLLFYLEGIAGLSVLTASYLILPVAVGTAVVGPFGGILSDRIGPRIVATVGLLLQAGALLFLTRLTTSTPLLDLALIEAVYGIGGGLFWPANTASIMSETPPAKYGVGSGIMNTFRQTGMVMSFALSLTAITLAVPAGIAYALFVGTISGGLSPHDAASYLSGQSLAFTVSLVLLMGAILLSLLRRPGRRETPPGAPEAAPPAEPAG
ncbi:MAG: MFS transporter [Thermoplasmata archaeon]|jgi:EmrB/QacA subfamily drug resistance transporter